MVSKSIVRAREEKVMALIECPECGKEISEYADSCPNCGFGVKKFITKKNEDEIAQKKQLENELRREEELKKKMDAVVLPRTKPMFNRTLFIAMVFCLLDVFFVYMNSQENLRGDGSIPIFMIIVCSLAAIICFVIGRSDLKEAQEMFDYFSHDEMAYRRILALRKESIEAQKEALQRAYANKHKSITNFEGQICCPKCGSTQIQMVPRKWTLTTGVLTNKVDRVCMNCKHRF